MTAGRPPKPAEMERAGHRQHAEVVEYTPVKAELVVPDLGERGLTEWEKIWRAGVWLHPSEDYHLVEMVCHAYDDLEEFREAVREQGLIAKGYAGQVVANPLIKEMRACEATIRKCLSMLGFSPTDRARLGLAELKRQTGLAELQAKTRRT